MDKSTLGKLGEDSALAHLQHKGYQLVERNWSCRSGEIDLIVRQANQWVFVEVKTCSGTQLDRAVMNMTPRKVERLTRAIFHYLHQHNLSEAFWQLDMVAVAVPARGLPLIEHWEQVLDW